MSWVIVIPALLVARTVWIRRWTLRAASERVKLAERTITVSVILQIAALFLMSPASADTIGWALHAISDVWNVDTWAGHCTMMAASALIVVNVKTRIDISHDEIRTLFKQNFERPLTVIAPISLWLLMASPNGRLYWPDLFNAPTDTWLDLYWTIVCGFVSFLLYRATVPLLILRRNPQNQRVATGYLMACTAGIAICWLRIISAWSGDQFTPCFWYTDCFATSIFAVASAYSWRQKVQRMKQRQAEL